MNFIALHQRWVHPLCKRWARFTDYSLTRRVQDGEFTGPRWLQYLVKALVAGGAVGFALAVGVPLVVAAPLYFAVLLAFHVGYVVVGRYPPDPLDWLHEVSCACLGVFWWVLWLLPVGAVLFAACYPYATP